MHKNSLFRVNTGGNFCGHFPEAPILYPTRPAKKGQGGIPGVLSALYERLGQFYVKPASIPSLNLANGKNRQMRSERREGCVRLLRAIVEATELASLRVGTPSESGFVNYTLPYLASRSGLSPYRAQRAFRDLSRAGLITVSQARRINDQGEYRGLPAVKVLSSKVFSIFGLQERLKHERKKAVQRLKRKAREWSIRLGEKRTLADIARFQLFNQGALQSAGSPKATVGRRAYNPPQESLEQRRRQMSLAAQIKTKNPAWSATECNEEARRRLLQDRYA